MKPPASSRSDCCGSAFCTSASPDKTIRTIATVNFMRTLKLIPVLLLTAALGSVACSEDAPAGNAEKGGMGAGRPETPGSVEGDPDEAQQVLGTTGHPEQQDSAAAGAPSMTGTLRDSLNDGEAIRGVNQPRPDRPGL